LPKYASWAIPQNKPTSKTPVNLGKKPSSIIGSPKKD
jgi:hypothetical protein